ncbi:MAG: hypothetical protein J7L25_12210 [Deltaproteobacteria bacterium]|nr:hypothetical protein [Candidatus Tharpella aukensis]
MNVSPVLNPGKHLFLKIVETTINAPECINPLENMFCKKESAQNQLSTKRQCSRINTKEKNHYHLWEKRQETFSIHIGRPVSVNPHPSDAGSQSSGIKHFNDKTVLLQALIRITHY